MLAEYRPWFFSPFVCRFILCSFGFFISPFVFFLSMFPCFFLFFIVSGLFRVHFFSSFRPVGFFFLINVKSK
jgi:hypothetical protein